MDEALEAIRACFHRDEDHLAILKFMQENNHQETDSVRYLEALMDKRYQKTLLILLVNVSFITINGPQTLTFFGQLILNNLYKRSPSGIDVSLALNLNLIAEALGLLLSIAVISRVSKKRMMLTYAIGLALMNAGMAMFIGVGQQWMMQGTMMLMFII
jgi:hypothetical protein